MAKTTSSTRAKEPEQPDILRLIPGYDPFATAQDCIFDPKAATRAIDFFHKCLSFTTGQWRGQPFILRPWQQSIIANVFGWIRPDGTRRYREVLIYVPRKSGKTETAAGLGNLLTFADKEPAAHVFCAAGDRDQARLVFNSAKQMILHEPHLERRSKVYRDSIFIPETGSIFRVISAEAYTKHGFNAHGVIIDELHAQPDRELVDVLTTSTGARRQPLIVYITTSDFDRNSICNEKHDYGCKVRDGIIEDAAFLPVIYEATRDEDWTHPEVWAKANPNLGVSVNLEYLQRECARAQETPTYENTFKRLHLNMKTQQDIRWLSLAAWDACTETIDESRLLGRKCFAGLDLSTTTDISALVLVFKEDNGSFSLLPKFWVPSDNARKREKRDRVPYETWARQGLIEMTPGNVIDYDYIRARINELAKRFKIIEIAIDPWNATQLATQLTADRHNVLVCGQNFKDMTSPTKELEKLVISGKLNHGGNPVLRWMASNVTVETDAAGNLKPSKKKSTERIDGIVAAIMGLCRALVHNKPRSVYETRGVIVI